MTVVTIELDDNVYARLEAQAASAHVSVEQLLAAVAISQSEVSTDSVSDEFRELIERQSLRYERLFARLAE